MIVSRIVESTRGVETRTWLTVVSVALCVALFVFLTPDQASAYTYKNSGKPGRTPTVYKVQGTHLGVECGLPSGLKCYTSWLIADGPVVTRSPAFGGTQRVTVLYTFKRWNGNNFAPFYRASAVRYIGAGTSAIRLPYGDVLPNPNNGYFRVQINISWKNGSGSRYYGSKVLYFNQNRDYYCNTIFTSACSVGSGSVYLTGAGARSEAGKSSQPSTSDSRQARVMTASNG